MVDRKPTYTRVEPENVIERLASIEYIHPQDKERVFVVTVEARDEGRFAVVHHRQVLSMSGEWEWEPQPSSRTLEFKDRTRFDLATAKRLAREQAARLFPDYFEEAKRAAERRNR